LPSPLKKKGTTNLVKPRSSSIMGEKRRPKTSKSNMLEEDFSPGQTNSPPLDEMGPPPPVDAPPPADDVGPPPPPDEVGPPPPSDEVGLPGDSEEDDE